MGLFFRHGSGRLVEGFLGSPRHALSAGTDIPQVIERVDSGAMPVIPEDANGVMTNRLSRVHLEPGLIHLKRTGGRIVCFLRLCSMGSGAGGARTFIPKILKRILAVMPVLPID